MHPTQISFQYHMVPQASLGAAQEGPEHQIAWLITSNTKTSQCCIHGSSQFKFWPAWLKIAYEASRFSKHYLEALHQLNQLKVI